jgi:hypothetical protein
MEKSGYRGNFTMTDQKIGCAENTAADKDLQPPRAGKTEPTMAQHDKYPFVAATMPTSRVSLLGLVATGLLLAAQSTAGAQESYRGTQAEQQACTDDVFRLCNQFVPDEQRIIACLAQNRPSLSPACRAVFSRGPEGRPRPRDGDPRR